MGLIIILLFAQSVCAQTNSLRAISDGIRQLVDRVTPAVVQISAKGITAESNPPRLLTSRSTGSGVLVDAGGYIITNAHVIGTAQQVQVTIVQPASTRDRFQSVLKPSGKIVPAEVIGVDRETDLAVLKVEGEGYPFLAFTDSDQIRQGHFVFAAGSPFGLDNSITMGVVSSMARQIRPDDPMIYIQTDASINPGNSGGPLLDSDGKIAGINTFILSQSGGNEGVGFAVPSNIVQNVYQQIRKYKRVRRGQVGVVAQTITPTLAAALELEQDWGVLVSDVTSGGSAESAGLEIKDIILTLNGKTMENARQFGVNIYQNAGETVTMGLLRGKQKLEKKVVVLERPRDPDRILSLLKGETNTIRKLGVVVVELDEKVTPMLPPLRRLSGVVVAGQAAGSAEHIDGLLPGDVIYECNNGRIRNIAELRTAVDTAAKGRNTVALHIERQGQLQYVLVDLE